MAYLAIGAAAAIAAGGTAAAVGASAATVLTVAQIGFAVGTVVASMLFPEPSQAGRLSDLKVQAASYGSPIPQVWGSYRLSGTVIWALDIDEHENHYNMFGKGGHSTYKYYGNWSVLFCTGPVEKVNRIWADGKLIYQQGDPNGKYNQFIRIHLGTEDQLPDPNIELHVGVGQVPAHRGTVYVVFFGFPLKDFANHYPTVHAEVNGFNKPAVNVARLDDKDPAGKYIAMTYLDSSIGLDAFGNLYVPVAAYDSLADAASLNAGFARTGARVGVTQAPSSLDVASTVPVTVGPAPDGTIPLVFEGFTSVSGGGFTTWTNTFSTHALQPRETYACYFVQGDGSLWVGTKDQAFDAGQGRILLLDSTSLQPKGATDTVPVVQNFYYQPSGFIETSSYVWLLAGHYIIGTFKHGVTGFYLDFFHSGTHDLWLSSIKIQTNDTPVAGAWPGGALSWFACANGQIPVSGLPNGQTVYAIPGTDDLACLIAHGGSALYLAKVTVVPGSGGPVEPPPLVEAGFAVSDITPWTPSAYTQLIGAVRVDSGHFIMTVADGGGTEHTLLVALSATPSVTWALSGTANGYPVSNGLAGTAFWFEAPDNSFKLVSLADGTVTDIKYLTDWKDPDKSHVDSQGLPLPYPFPSDIATGQQKAVLYSPYENALIFRSQGQGFYSGSGQEAIYKLTPGTTTSAADLGVIVRAICLQCGLTDAQIDVSGINGHTVPGYCVPRASSGRDAIQLLQNLFLFDGADTNGKLTFRMRTGASVATLTQDDLAVREWGANSTGDAEGNVPRMVETRTQDIELPESFTLQYADGDADYMIQTATAKRNAITMHSKNKVNVDVPCTLYRPGAQAAAFRTFYQTWIARSQYTFTLGPDAIRYDAGDVLTINNSGVQYRVYISSMSLGANNVIEMQGVSNDPEVYISVAHTNIGPSAGYVAQSRAATLPDTTSRVLDIPLLQAAQDAPGYYAAGTGFPNWPSAVLYESLDNVNFGAKGAYTVAAVIGSVQGTLPTGTSWFFDYSYTIDVGIPAQKTLQSVTEAQVTAGANVAMFGSEMIGFASAVQVGTGTRWRLTGLLRGMQGTEWAMASHVAGENFVVLSNDGSIIDVPEELSVRGQTRYFKGVTTGADVESAAAQTVVAQFVRLKPLSPVHIAATRDGSNNVTLTWVRRARYNAAWAPGVDVPLDEPTEAYEIDILSGGGAVLRTLTAATPTAAYSAANQTTDGLTPGNPVSVKVYQISSRVGRGYPGSATV